MVEDREQDEDELYEHHRILVDKGQQLVRIDKFLFDRLPNTSRNRIQNSVRAESVLVNKKPVKPNYKIKPDDVITISLPHPPRDTDLKAEDIPLNIVYEDDSLLVVNKPPGMVVHPAFGNWDGTLVNGLLYHFQNLPTTQSGAGRPGLVHRIDKDTSGLLLIAKSEFALSFLARQFFEHSIERTYYALVWGVPEEKTGTINAPLGRSAHDRRITTVQKDPEKGKEAITHYKVLDSFGYCALIQCNLETGRTHQIRAHMKFLGHPIFGDEMYGGFRAVKGPEHNSYLAFVDNCLKIMPRQGLHAKTLGFVHPDTRKFIQFDSELPDDFRQVLDRWANYAKAKKLGEDGE